MVNNFLLQTEKRTTKQQALIIMTITTLNNQSDEFSSFWNKGGCGINASEMHTKYHLSQEIILATSK